MKWAWNIGGVVLAMSLMGAGHLPEEGDRCLHASPTPPNPIHGCTWVDEFNRGSLNGGGLTLYESAREGAGSLTMVHNQAVAINVKSSGDRQAFWMEHLAVRPFETKRFAHGVEGMRILFTVRLTTLSNIKVIAGLAEQTPEEAVDTFFFKSQTNRRLVVRYNDNLSPNWQVIYLGRAEDGSDSGLQTFEGPPALAATPTWVEIDYPHYGSHITVRFYNDGDPDTLPYEVSIPAASPYVYAHVLGYGIASRGGGGTMTVGTHEVEWK